MKHAQIVDRGGDRFGLEYEDTLGRKNTMRLDAVTYEGALREAKSFLGINGSNLDEDGTVWELE
ncbi:MAG TPA: hypothetical protein VFZ59_03535 [Verrucomicrobiae bacterium]|nr:hypothetical protein [Verrucomicrobiae bacterium]